MNLHFKLINIFKYMRIQIQAVKTFNMAGFKVPAKINSSPSFPLHALHCSTLLN